jgi:hypothetical protein
MRALLRGGLVLALVSLGTPGLSEAQEELTRRDQRGPVTVAVTPIPPVAAGDPLKVKVVLDTHSVGLDTIQLDKAVVLRAAGSDVAPTAVERATGGGHHREAVLVFPPPGQADGIRIVVKNVGGAFAWELPLAR